MSERNFDFNQEIEKSLQNINKPKPKSLLPGRVVLIAENEVFIDIKWTSEVIVPLEEFANKPEIDDTVYIWYDVDKDGAPIFSKKIADKKLEERELQQIYRRGLSLKAKIISYNKEKKYFTAVYKNLNCKVPIYEIDTKFVSDENINDYLDKEFEFKILNYKRNNIVLSRKEYLINRAKEEKIKFFKEKNKGDIVECEVVKILNDDKGVIVDLGGFTGFIPKREVSYSRFFNTSDILEEGQKIKAKIVLMTRNSNKKEDKIVLSIKQAKEDPWKELKYQKDDIVKGIVKKVFPDGVYVEIEEGVEGFIRKSDFSWVQDERSTNEIAKLGEIIEAKILSIDFKNRKLRLGVKHILPNPWDTIEERYVIGKKVKGIIKRITNFGVFIELEKGIEGLLRKQELSWTKNLNPEDLFKDKVGEEIEVVVKKIEKEKKRIALSLRELFDNPWKNLQANYPQGSTIEVIISDVQPKKLVAKINEEIEAIIPISEVAIEKIASLEDKFKIGDKVVAKVKILDPNRKKFLLSIKELILEEQNKEINKFIFDNKEAKINLGELLSKK